MINKLAITMNHIMVGKWSYFEQWYDKDLIQFSFPSPFIMINILLTHWGRVTHIRVSKQTIIGSDNGLSPDRRQAIIWTNAGLLLIGPLGKNFSEILVEILAFSFKKMCLKVSSAKRRPFCLGLNVLRIMMNRDFFLRTYFKFNLFLEEKITSQLRVIELVKY